MNKTYKILSLLLSYPDTELQDFLQEAISALKEESLLKQTEIQSIEKFANNYSSISLIQWQEQYVQLFDFTRSVSLHLFEHVHGDSRDRGQAMIDLADEYSNAGLKMNVGELPDYLPAFLEYLSLIDGEKAAALLGETIHIIVAIHKKLSEKSQPYAHIFSALIGLSDKPADINLVETIVKNQKVTDFDSDYDEPPVTLEGSESACTNCKI